MRTYHNSLLLLCLIALLITSCTNKTTLSSSDSLKIVTEYLKKQELNTIRFDVPVAKGISPKAIAIDSAKASSLHKLFTDRLTTGAIKNWVYWNPDVKGWSIPATQVQAILENKAKKADSLNIYIAINDKLNIPSLILIGSYYDQETKKSKLIFGKNFKDPSGKSYDDQIYEYVDPCNPKCPENSF